MRRGELVDELQAAGVPVSCFDVRSRANIFVVWKLARALRKQKPAILQTFLYHANLVGRFAGRLAGVPKIVSGIRVAERRSSWRLRLDRWTERLVDRHVCVSPGVAEFSIQAGLSREKIEVIPNGVDFERFATAEPADLTEFGIARDAQVVLSVARLDPQKGIDLLIEAFATLASKFPKAELLLVGDGPSRRALVEQVARSGVESRIHFAGYRRDTPGLYRAAQVFVLPSRWEGMPNAVLEAMAAGCPVVATRVEGTEGLRCVWLSEVDSAAELAAWITLALSDPALGEQMASQSQVFVQNDLTWERVVGLYDHLYRDLTVR
jgi:glycosyltransferase involved in cell wall biosynthesis